jgi:hypothetical protein
MHISDFFAADPSTRSSLRKKQRVRARFFQLIDINFYFAVSVRSQSVRPRPREGELPPVDSEWGRPQTLLARCFPFGDGRQDKPSMAAAGQQGPNHKGRRLRARTLPPQPWRGFEPTPVGTSSDKCRDTLAAGCDSGLPYRPPQKGAMRPASVVRTSLWFRAAGSKWPPTTRHVGHPGDHTKVPFLAGGNPAAPPHAQSSARCRCRRLGGSPPARRRRLGISVIVESLERNRRGRFRFDEENNVGPASRILLGTARRSRRHRRASPPAPRSHKS